jgi:hypothetical protein
LKFLLTTSTSLETSKNPDPRWLTEKSWGEICRASKLIPKYVYISRIGYCISTVYAIGIK